MAGTYTLHSVERTMERCGLKRRAAQRLLGRVLHEGKPAEAFTSWERSYLENETSDGEALVFSDYVFILKDDKVITVHALPAWWGEKKHFRGKERIRNMKKYINYIPEEYDE